MLKGWAEHPGGRHHGAHGAAVSKLLDVSARYPDPGYPRLREALAAYLGVSSDKIVPTNGGTEALFLAALSAGVEGKALILEPTFSEYAAAARAAGLEPVRRVVRRPEDGFR